MIATLGTDHDVVDPTDVGPPGDLIPLPGASPEPPSERHRSPSNTTPDLASNSSATDTPSSDVCEGRSGHLVVAFVLTARGGVSVVGFRWCMFAETTRPDSQLCKEWVHDHKVGGAEVNLKREPFKCSGSVFCVAVAVVAAAFF